MSLSVNNLSSQEAYSSVSWPISFDLDSANKADVLRRFAHIYDAPHDNSCLYWSLIFTTFLPLLENEDLFRKKYVELFEQTNIEQLRPFKELLSSYDGYRVYGSWEFQSFLIYHLRVKLVSYMLDHEKDFSPYMEDDESLRVYTSRMLNMSSWGGEAEIRAFSDLFSVPIFVVSPRLSFVRVFRSDLSLENALCLQHTIGGNHYEFLLENPIVQHSKPECLVEVVNPFTFSFGCQSIVKEVQESLGMIRPLARRLLPTNQKDTEVEDFVSIEASLGVCSSATPDLSDEEILSISFKEPLNPSLQLDKQNGLEILLRNYMMSSSISDIEEEILKPLRDDAAYNLSQIILPFDIAQYSQSEVLYEIIIGIFRIHLNEDFLTVHESLKMFFVELLKFTDKKIQLPKNPLVLEFSAKFLQQLQCFAPNQLLAICYLIADDIAINMNFQNIDLSFFDRGHEGVSKAFSGLMENEKIDEAMSVLDLIFNRIHRLARQ